MRRTKLTDRARRRIRVCDLAKEADMSPADMLTMLASIDEYAPSALAYIEHPVAERIRRQLGLETPPPPPTWKEEAGFVTPRLEPGDGTPRTPSTGLTPPKPQPPRNNNPLMPEARRARDDVPYRLPPREADKRRKARPMGHSTATPPPAHAAFGTQDSSPTMAEAAWAVYGLTPQEREQWTEAGLRPTQARDASRLKEAGLTPADLGQNVDGWTALERLLKGEGAASVARLVVSTRATEMTDQSGTLAREA